MCTHCPWRRTERGGELAMAGFRPGSSRAYRRSPPPGTGRSTPRRTCGSRRRRPGPPGSGPCSRARMSPSQSPGTCGEDRSAGYRPSTTTAEVGSSVRRCIWKARVPSDRASGQVLQALALHHSQDVAVLVPHGVVTGGEGGPFGSHVPTGEPVAVALPRVDHDREAGGERTAAGDPSSGVGRRGRPLGLPEDGRAPSPR